MGDVLIARIIKYLNGTLFYDPYYFFCEFVVNHYLEMPELSYDEVVEMSKVDPRSILAFLAYLGFKSYDEFKDKLIADMELRQNQIRARMISLDKDALMKEFGDEVSCGKIDEYITNICKSIDSSKRVYIIGALYGLSISVEFQTDLATFGKTVYQYHHFDHVQFNEDDVVIFISATGRAIQDFLSSNTNMCTKCATSLLITQNPIYTKEENKITDYVLQVPGNYDGVDFNYSIMRIFDLLRIQYYSNYYMDKK